MWGSVETGCGLGAGAINQWDQVEDDSQERPEGDSTDGIEGMEEIRKWLDFMSAELSTISKNQELLTERMDEIKSLKRQLYDRHKKIL